MIQERPAAKGEGELRILKKEQVSLDGARLVTEASTAGLRPGEWPSFISVLNDVGVGFLFGPTRRRLPDGGFCYYSRGGAELHVLND